MERHDASLLDPGLPATLPALRLCQRIPSGPTQRFWAGGDLGLSGRLAPGARGEAPAPLARLAPALAALGPGFANLETPLVPDADPADLFAAPPAGAVQLAAAGLRVLSLANNHVADYGAAGIESSLAAVTTAGLSAVGAGADAAAARQLVVLELETLRLGWLAAARSLAPQPPAGPAFWELERDELLAAVEAAKPTVDLLAVSLHLGFMYVDYPHPEHRQLALDLAAAGADLVLGHHAHVVQGIEVAPGGALLCHNLGNLVFDWTEGEVAADLLLEEQRSGIVLVLDLDPQGVARATALPVRVDDGWQLDWAEGEAGERILERLERLSQDLGGDYAAEFWRQRGTRNTGLTLATLARRLRRGDFASLAAAALRVRPHHLGMIGRWLFGRKRRA